MPSPFRHEPRPSAETKLRRAGWYAAFGLIPFGTSLPGLLIVLVDRLRALFARRGGAPAPAPVRLAEGLMAALMASVLLSGALSSRPGTAFPAGLGFFLTAFGLFFGAVELGRRAPEDLHRRYLPVLVLAGLAACAVSLLRYAAVPQALRAGGYRAVNLFTGCNGLGTTLIFLGGLGLTHLVSRGGKWRRLIPLFLALVCLTLLASGSRGAWIGFAGMIITLCLFNRKYLLALLASALIVGILFHASPLLMDRLEKAFSLEANTNRLYIWRSTLAMIRDHPVVGIGAGVFPYVFKDYMIAGATESSPAFAHNIFLQLLAEFGLIGFAIFAALLFSVLVLGLGLARLGHPVYQGIFAALVGILLHQQVDCTIYGIGVGGSFWMLLGLVLGLYAHEKARGGFAGKCRRRGDRSPFMTGAIPLAILLCFAAAAPSKAAEGGCPAGPELSVTYVNGGIHPCNASWEGMLRGYEIEIGWVPLNWGPSREGNLSFAPVRGHLMLRMAGDFSGMELIPPFHWEQAYILLEPRAGEGRGMVARRYEIQAGRWRLGYIEAALLTGDFSPWYLNPYPLIPLEVTQLVLQYLGDPGGENRCCNMIMALDASRDGDRLDIYGSLYVDDLPPTGEWASHYKVGLQAGCRLERPLGSAGTELSLEYTAITRHTYTFYAEWPQGDYVDGDLLLGHPLGPDADLVRARLSWDEGEKWLEVRRERHGEGRFPDPMEPVAARTWELLTGTVETTYWLRGGRSFALAGRLRLELEAGVGYARNLDHIAGRTGMRWSLEALLAYAL